jgi:hypothetical protein
MKIFPLSICFMMTFTSSSSFAAVDTMSILEAQKDAIIVRQSINLGNHHITNEIEICLTNDCDMFTSQNASSLVKLADYVYLYSVYKGEYVDFSKPLPSGGFEAAPYVAQAKKEGYAKEVLDSYLGEYKCEADKDTVNCVLRSISKAYSIRHYRVTYDEGSRIQTLVKN